MIRVFRDTQGLVLESAGEVRRAPGDIGFDDLFTAADPVALVRSAWESGVAAPLPEDPGTPIGS